MVQGHPAEARSGGAWRLVIIWTLVALIALVWAMHALHLDPSPTVEAGANNLRALTSFWGASAAGWIGLTVMWMMLRRKARDATGGDGPFWKPVVMILGVALATRAAVLITHEPSLSHDVYRYVFDGRNLAAGYNPYLIVPAERLDAPAERWPGERELVPRLAFPELATPYLPVSEAVFGAIGLTISTRRSDPSSSARAFRGAFVVIEVVMMLTLVAALKRAGRSAWWVALYAWHPLPISELAGSGHQEVIGVACLVASLAIFGAVPGKTWRWTTPLALSALGKPITLPAGPIMLRGRPAREWLTCAATGTVALAACLAPPWLIWGDHGRAFQNWYKTIEALGERARHFGGVYEAVLAAVYRVTPTGGTVLGFELQPERVAHNVCLAIVGVAGIAIFWSRSDAWHATRALLFVVVLLAAAAHPWYLLWAIALFPMADNLAIWVFSLTLPWGYAAWADIAHRRVPPWLLAAAYGPVLLALVWDGVRHSTHRERDAGAR
jgi:alpha-1,6-mannosyltransferase